MSPDKDFKKKSLFYSNEGKEFHPVVITNLVNRYMMKHGEDIRFVDKVTYTILILFLKPLIIAAPKGSLLNIFAL